VELRLVVEAPGVPEREVALDLGPQHQICQVTAALAGHLDVEGRLGLYSHRLGRWLEDPETVASIGLRSGDRLLLADPHGPTPAPTPASQALVELRCLGGPSAGLRLPLATGDHRVGSFRYSNVVLQDPALARVHLIVSVSPFGSVTVADPGTDAGTWREGQRLVDRTPIGQGEVLALGHSLIGFEPLADRRPLPAPDAQGRIAFNRPPRMALSQPETTFKLKPPPERKSGFHLPLSSALVPPAMGVVMYFASGHNPTMLLFCAFSPLMVAVSLLEGKIGGRREFRRGLAGYQRQLAELEGQVAEARRSEAEYLRACAPDLCSLLDRARSLDPSLWERRPDSPDWLWLRVGWADRDASIRIEVPEQGEEGLRREADRLLAKQRRLHAAPSVVSLQEAGVLGLAGDPERVAALARALVAQLAVLHSPEDLVLAAAVPPAERQQWSWLGWLPHLGSESAPLPGALLASERAEVRDLVDRLGALVSERREARRSLGGSRGERLGCSVVAVFHDEAELPRGAVTALLQQGPAVGVHAVFIGRQVPDLPGECGAVVEVQPAGDARLVFPATGAEAPLGGADGLAPELARELALTLAPVRDVSARSSQAGVPRQVNLVQLLGLERDPQAGIMAAWIKDRSAPQERTLSARWGVAAGAEVFSVSLREDGPHALVGGMTGSGKSELLQSLVASLAATYSPRTLNFLLVDYKGGAAFKDCVHLPHTVGFVTDLDGHLVTRALTSLRAELRRREEILRQAGAKDLIDLEMRHPDIAPASLLIVVDEFAALATELPEFVDGMVDIAQRGRSLGIHLLLATQRPQGVINDRIRANTNLRVSLRFSDESESMDVVGTRDAARPGLPPGRAFARTGPGEVTEFQAGYVGGRTRVVSGPAPVAVRDLGRPEQRRQEPRRAEVEEETDLQVLVQAIREVNRRLELPPPPRPWLPTLPEVLPLGSLPQPAGPVAALGLVDDPAAQRQLPLQHSFAADGSLLVFGTSGSGKTTLMRSIGASLALALPPDRLHLYGLDFATRGLRPLEALPHCGSVVAGDEPERAVRLLRMLGREAERRKGLLSMVGASSLAEYAAARPQEVLPYLVVLLDGLPNFVSAFENVDLGAHIDALRSLLAEGRPLGISFVVGIDRQGSFITQIQATVTRRLILRLASEDEYGYLGIPRSVYAGAHLPPGRGFTEAGMEVQTPVVGEDAAGSAQAAALAALGEQLARHCGPVQVPEVRLLPKVVSRSSLPTPSCPLEAVIGLADRDLEPVRVDLAEGHFVVAGPRRSGRTTALAALACSLASAGNTRLHLLCPRRRSSLAKLPIWDSTAIGAEACGQEARRVAGAARESGAEAVVVVDDAEDLADEAVPDLDWIAQRGREHGLRLVIGVETQAAQRMFNAWMQQALRDRQGILLDPDPTMDGTLLGVPRLPPRQGGAWPAGRGYLVRRGAAELIQVASG
jgi:S-DNA-T family DNA segregation ATPase FtsK/SpoIIIE